MKKLIVANWKMYLGFAESVALAKKIMKDASRLGSKNNWADIVFCPSFVALEEVAKVVHGTKIKLGAQDVEPEKRGAFTGEVGLDDLGEIGVQYVLVGHSERRREFHETDAVIKKKLRAVLDARMRPILCIGEPLSVRKKKTTRAFLHAQLRSALKNIPKRHYARLIVAYEPIWAIGTGHTDSLEDIETVAGDISHLLPHIPFLYGGSVTGKNAGAILSLQCVSGLLVGKASTHARMLQGIVNAAAKTI